MANTTEYQGPLAGLKVIDFGHYYAGPMVGMLLADQGADVIRIMKPGGCELFEQQFRLLNRNKKLLTLDLKMPEGKAQAQALIDNADVLVENFRPGVMKRLGLDYATVKATNPGLVYLSLPGFSSKDKARAHIQAWEGIIAAASGLFTEAHYFRQSLGFPPVYASIPLSSAYGSMYGAIAVLAALVTREEHGSGTVIEAPLVDAGLSTVIDKFMLRAAQPATAASIPEELKYSPDDDKETQLKKLETHWGGGLFDLYDSADGRKMLLFHVKPKFAERLFNYLGIWEQLESEGYIIEDAWKGRWQNNIAYFGMDKERVKPLRRIMEKIMRTKTADEWDAIMADIGVPFTYNRTREEWLALEPMHQSGVLTKMNNGKSVISVPGRAADMSGPGGVQKPVTPKEPTVIDATTANNLFSPSTDNQPNTAWKPQKKSDLLKNLKVLDICSIVAGPTSAYTLAQYGADVIRAEPPESFNLPLHLTNMLEVNQGKRSIIVDIKTAPGREVFRRLVRWGDVVVHNRPDDIDKRLGVTLEQLQQINPNVVVCQMSALGGTWRNNGGWEKRLGYDPIANMPSGLFTHYGTLDRPQAFGGISADLMGGFGLAFSALLGVYQFKTTGYAGEGRNSLARATTYNQLVWMIAENGSSNWGEARGQFTLGQNWWARIYQCSDRRIYVETPEDRASLLAEIVTGYTATDEQAMAAAFASKDSSYWLKTLGEAGIASHLVFSADDICIDANVRRVSNEAADEQSNGLFEVLRWDDHPSGIPIMIPAISWVRIGEDHSYKRLTPTCKVGTHTREILSEMDFSQDEIDEMYRLRVAHDYLPAIGSKDAYFFAPKD